MSRVDELYEQAYGSKAPTEAEGAKMSAVQRITSPVALRFNAGKAPLSLIPKSAQIAEAEVLAFGATKYAAHNWRKGFGWCSLADSSMRHILSFLDGEDLDPESLKHHIAHARANLGFLIEHIEKGLGTDDRFKK